MRTLSDIPTRLAMPCPFAGDTGANLATIGTVNGDVINFKDGFPSPYSAPASAGGKYVSRGELNAIGNMATRDNFFARCGGINTFDPDFAIQIGGYPKGAVLQIVNQGALWFVESLVENNMIDFTRRMPTTEQSAAGITMGSVDGVNWRYCYESKYVESDETVLVSYKNDIESPGNCRASELLRIKKSPLSGFVTITNLVYDITSSYKYSMVYYNPNVYLSGHGILISIRDETSISSFEPLSVLNYSTEAAKFHCHLFDAGECSVWSWSQSGTTVSTNRIESISQGLLYVNAGEYVCICLLNGGNANNIEYMSNDNKIYTATHTINSFSFDVSIV